MFKKSFCVFIFLCLLQCSGPETEGGKATEAKTVVLDAESCSQIKFKSECSEFTGAAKTVAKTLCEEGTHATTQCPSSFVGKCDTGKGIAKVYYAAGQKSYNLKSAQADCKLMEGEFKTP